MKMQGRFSVGSMTIALLLCGCATQATRPQVASAPTLSVPAAGETAAVATRMADAADDPAIWTGPNGVSFAGQQHPGILLGTDKKAGLYVFGLSGQVLQFLPEGLLNNVDLRGEGQGFLAGASDRGRMGIALYRYDGAGQIRPAGFIKSDLAEPYGFCMGRIGGELVAVVIGKDGQVREYTVDGQGDARTGTERRRFAVGTQSEGCAIDDATATLYIGEEMKGVWRYPLQGPVTRTLVAGVGDGRLVADVEGVTLLRDQGETFLIVSSQGDDAFAVWTVGATPGTEHYVGRFRVAASGGVDGVSGTDGVDAWSGPIGPYSRGLLAMQDNANDGQAQNFKLVDWATVRAALQH